MCDLNGGKSSCFVVRLCKSGQMIFNQIIIVKVLFRCNLTSPCLSGLINLVQKINLPLWKNCMERLVGNAKEGSEVDMMRLIDKVKALTIFGLDEEKQFCDRRLKYLERK